jgi:hypothetical protein
MFDHLDDPYDFFNLDEDEQNFTDSLQSTVNNFLKDKRKNEFIEALTTAWKKLDELQPRLQKLFALPSVTHVRGRDKDLIQILDTQLDAVCIEYRDRKSDFVPLLGQIDWFRIELISAMWDLVRPTPAKTEACDKLRTVNDRFAQWGITDKTGLLALINTYLNLNPVPAAVDGIVLTCAISGGTDKSRDEQIQTRYAALTQPMPLTPVGRPAADIARLLDVEFPWMRSVTQ